MSEKAFQGAVLEYAALLGWRYFHTHDSRRSVQGYPDLTLVKGRRLIFAELKTDVGQLSPEQRGWLADLESTAAEVYVWRPRDWNDIIETLTRRDAPAAREAIAA